MPVEEDIQVQQDEEISKEEARIFLKVMKKLVITMRKEKITKVSDAHFVLTSKKIKSRMIHAIEKGEKILISELVK